MSAFSCAGGTNAHPLINSLPATSGRTSPGFWPATTPPAWSFQPPSTPLAQYRPTLAAKACPARGTASRSSCSSLHGRAGVGQPSDTSHRRHGLASPLPSSPIRLLSLLPLPPSCPLRHRSLLVDPASLLHFSPGPNPCMKSLHPAKTSLHPSMAPHSYPSTPALPSSTSNPSPGRPHVASTPACMLSRPARILPSPCPPASQSALTPVARPRGSNSWTHTGGRHKRGLRTDLTPSPALPNSSLPSGHDHDRAGNESGGGSAGGSAGGAPGLIRVADEVQRALASGSPVVALESTIVCHGMPYPQNLSTAREVEREVRDSGAVPATVAILEGVPHVGLTDTQLEQLARLGTAASKTARRDLAVVVAKGLTGATTVSATMFLAFTAGIHVFVTGGIGGVHRGGEKSLDISSDLTELGRTPMAVVCAGAKSVLDIPRTLEYLETQGVTVAAYQTDAFPAFFTADSGCKAACRFDSPEECAAVLEANLRLGLGSGLVLGVPIPAQYAAGGEKVEEAIRVALEESEGHVTGAEVTPFLLKRINELTAGESLAANIALVKHNAAIGALIAAALSRKIAAAGPPAHQQGSWSL